MLLKVGWMHKYRKLLQLSWWNNYWFVLNQVTCTLSYYKCPQRLRRVGEFQLTGNHVVWVGDRIGNVRMPPWLSKENLLYVTSSKKRIILCCNHKAEADSWKEILDTFRPEFFPHRQRITAKLLQHTLPEENLPMMNFKNFGVDQQKAVKELFKHHIDEHGLAMDDDEDGAAAAEEIRGPPDDEMEMDYPFDYQMNWHDQMHQMQQQMMMMMQQQMYPMQNPYGGPQFNQFGLDRMPSVMNDYSRNYAPAMENREILGMMAKLLEIIAKNDKGNRETHYNNEEEYELPQPKKSMRKPSTHFKESNYGVPSSYLRSSRIPEEKGVYTKNSNKVDSSKSLHRKYSMKPEALKVASDISEKKEKTGKDGEVGEVLSFLESFQSRKNLNVLERKMSKNLIPISRRSRVALSKYDSPPGDSTQGETDDNEELRDIR